MAMAMVHEQLYTSENVARIEFGQYLKNLVSTIAAANRLPECTVTVSYSVVPVYFSIEQAVPLGLWANEVITNSYKHAFVGVSEGEIRIELDDRIDYVEFTITDSGPGLAGARAESGTSLGTQLIIDLPEQVNATMARLDSPSFGYVLHIPREVVGPARDDADQDDDTPSLFD